LGFSLCLRASLARCRSAIPTGRSLPILAEALMLESAAPLPYVASVPSLDKLVRFAFKVGASVPPLTQTQWEGVLLAAGADLRIARRIVFFAPNTAARMWLRDEDVTFLSNDYTLYAFAEGATSTTHLPLSAEPVFHA
jgi:hypothetical protein